MFVVKLEIGNLIRVDRAFLGFPSTLFKKILQKAAKVRVRDTRISGDDVRGTLSSCSTPCCGERVGVHLKYQILDKQSIKMRIKVADYKRQTKFGIINILVVKAALYLCFEKMFPDDISEPKNQNIIFFVFFTKYFHCINIKTHIFIKSICYIDSKHRKS